MARDRTTYGRIGDRALHVAEDIIYIGIATLLFLGGAALLVDAALGLRNIGDDTENVVLQILDELLLVFIVVELLFAVRTTLEKREIVAEPFLVVGIIASIKEIIVLSVEAADQIGGKGRPGAFRDSVTEIGVLGVLVILLAVSSYLLRRKEREPQEGREDSDTSSTGHPRNSPR